MVCVALSSVAPGLTSVVSLVCVALSSVADGLTPNVSVVCVDVVCSTWAHSGC